MKRRTLLVMALLAALFVGALQLRAQDKPIVQIPQPGVPQIQTLEGKFIRVAYNNEGYAILGYQASNRSVGEEWMLLEFGMTVLNKTPEYRMPRAAFTLDTPDGKTLPLPSVIEQREGNPRTIIQRANVQRDKISYFPADAYRACGIGFFPDLGAAALPQDNVDVSKDKACVGRLFFKIPGGIAYGQYWLNVKFQNSLVRVPFRILTADEEKLLSKNYKSIEKQVKEAFKPKKK
jgi:hypothetical protein